MTWEQKHYHLDWTLPPKDAQRFENLVAVHLKKWVDFEADAKGRELELRYFRDVQGREVDFVITENRGGKQGFSDRRGHPRVPGADVAAAARVAFRASAEPGRGVVSIRRAIGYLVVIGPPRERDQVGDLVVLLL